MKGDFITCSIVPHETYDLFYHAFLSTVCLLTHINESVDSNTLHWNSLKKHGTKACIIIKHSLEIFKKIK